MAALLETMAASSVSFDLVSERLRLRELESSDIDAVQRYATDPQVVEHPEVKAVIFDLWGTLIHPWQTSASQELRDAFCASSEIAPHEFQQAWNADRDMRELGSLDDSYLRVAEALGAASPSRDLLSRMLDLRKTITASCLNSPRTDAVSTLIELRARGISAGLISNCAGDVTAVWSDTVLAPLIDHPVFSCAVGIAKPDRRIYELVRTALRVSPANCLYVGDGGSDELAGAQRVGMRAVQLQTGDTGIEPWGGERILALSDVLHLV